MRKKSKRKKRERKARNGGEKKKQKMEARKETEKGVRRQMRLKKAKRCTILLTVSLMGILAFPSWAETSDSTSRTLVEYENLRELLKAGNPDLTQSYADYDASVEPYQEMWDTLKKEQKYMEDMAESYEDDGDEEMQVFYENNAKQLEKSAGQINVRIQNLTSESRTKNLEKAADAQTVAAQSLMNSYNQMVQNIRASEKSAEAAEAAYEEAQTKQAAGTAKAADVQTAKETADREQNSLESLREQAAQLKTALLSMLGLDGAAAAGQEDTGAMESGGSASQVQIEIGTVPQPDLEAIRAIDKEADKAVSISNDSALFNQRREKATGTDERALRDQNIAQAEAEAEMTYLSAYDDLMYSLNSYEAASQAYEAAKLDYQALQIKKEAGMLSRTAWLSGEAAYMKKEVAKEIAAMSLYQAYETYCWTVKGVV